VNIGWGAGLLALALQFCGSAVAQSPPGRCALVCPPEQVLDVAKCICQARAPMPHLSCMLVCPAPDQMLDAEHCRCVAAH
jgi:hypothetical protein